MHHFFIRQSLALLGTFMIHTGYNFATPFLLMLTILWNFGKSLKTVTYWNSTSPVTEGDGVEELELDDYDWNFSRFL